MDSQESMKFEPPNLDSRTISFDELSFSINFHYEVDLELDAKSLQSFSLDPLNPYSFMM